MAFPNGMVVTPDGATLIVAETFGLRLSAFDVAADGSLGARRVFADLGLWPDGICLDAEGAVWVASPATSEVVRVRDGGEVTDRISVADQRAYACMLGGPDGRTLHICTAKTHVPADTIEQRAGRIETAQVRVPRAGLP